MPGHNSVELFMSVRAEHNDPVEINMRLIPSYFVLLPIMEGGFHLYHKIRIVSMVAALNDNLTDIVNHRNGLVAIGDGHVMTGWCSGLEVMIV